MLLGRKHKLLENTMRSNSILIYVTGYFVSFHLWPGLDLPAKCTCICKSLGKAIGPLQHYQHGHWEAKDARVKHELVAVVCFLLGHAICSNKHTSWHWPCPWPWLWALCMS